MKLNTFVVALLAGTIFASCQPIVSEYCITNMWSVKYLAKPSLLSSAGRGLGLVVLITGIS